MKNQRILICAIILLMFAMYSCQPSAPPTPTSIPTAEATQTESPTPEPTITPSPTRPVDPVTLRVLFIGSSHVYYTRAGINLPRVFARLAESGGHTVIVDHAAEAGVWLEDHVADPSTLAKIESAEWDYIVLQEDMYVAADKARREEFMYPAVRTLDRWIKDNGAQTILYLTWVHPGPIRDDEYDIYFDEQARLTEGYLEIAQELGALVAPAGIAFENALQQQPDIYLWFEGDDSGHASGMGQYLTAAVFYTLIYQESPEDLGFLTKPEDTARFMQTIAAETVLTNPIPTTTDSTPTASTAGETWIRPTDGMVMLYIPEGEIEIGSTESEIQAAVGECKRDRGQEHCDISWFEDETPLHSVSLPAYWIDQTEVTNAQYAAFLKEYDNQVEEGVAWLDMEESRIEQTGDSFRILEGYADHPVIEVTWYGARAYCKSIGGQLPTEEQWEYAARGPERRLFPWGDAAPTCTFANYLECQGSTLPVGSMPDGDSWYGAKDMSGNAWEWTYNWYLPYPGNNIENEDYGRMYKVIKGGSWNLEAYYLRSALRSLEYSPDVSLEHIGFRCVIPIDD